jgi:predicted Zn-dependent protease
VVPAPEVELGPDACYDAGYLCRGLTERQSPRILRWPSETNEIRIRVPMPPLEDRRLARELQDAAVLGIRAWDGTPFRLRVERADRSGSEDIVIRWTDRLDGAELGRAETEWQRSSDGRMEMRVTDFALVMRNPVRAGRMVTPQEMRLIAAHEMGHALGLPHSDVERDVMYPTNTATRLSPRDYQTMNALYGLTNGAILTREALAAARNR